MIEEVAERANPAKEVMRSKSILVCTNSFRSFDSEFEWREVSSQEEGPRRKYIFKEAGSFLSLSHFGEESSIDLKACQPLIGF